MDFYRIKERSSKNGVVEIFPDFRVCRSKDLMVRGKSFYAVWDEAAGLWSTDEYDVQRLVDEDLLAYRAQLASRTDATVNVKLMSDFSTKSWSEFRNYIGHISDNSHQLDGALTFANTVVKKTDYVSKRLPYPLEAGVCDAYEEIVSTLYVPEERAKLEWAIGAVVAGDAKCIQKFVVLYGPMGAGKSTVLNIIQKLFEGYYTSFEAKALTSSSNAFSTEAFKNNPLVAIQHDGDLSRIEDNTKLNSIISHEDMTINEKYKPSYMSRVNSFLFMGTNKPVKITDAKSGIIRRLIDIQPSGERLKVKRYHLLMGQIDFELGAIAAHCLAVYRSMGKDYYAGYRPVEMMLQTDVFYNYVEAYYHVFKEQDGVSIQQAYEMYKAYCEEALVDFKLPRHKFRDELKNYFRTFSDRMWIDGKNLRSYYSGFMTEKFTAEHGRIEEPPSSLVLDHTESLLDTYCAELPAQYAKADETPARKWETVNTVLSDLDTKKTHYVKLPSNHIVIDFDLKDENGEKSAERNLNAASKWPPTYTEYSKSGSGIHLHYIYTGGEPEELSRVFDDGIEVKVFTGNSSLRRRLSRCNNVPVAKLNSGLALRERKMLNFESVQSERGLRALISRNLRKEIHPGTKPSIDFIYKILEDAYASGLNYDVSDMKQGVLTFALNSSNQAEYCLKTVAGMKFKSEEVLPGVENHDPGELVLFDVEVFPNLFHISWKFQGENNQVVRMVNPTPAEVESLLKLKLIGYNNRRYDNHILYARYLGYNDEELYRLSQRIISGDRTALFGAAYNLSYTDVYDFSSKKQSLKKFEIELGLNHLELGFPWNEPVPEDKWDQVAEYCDNDVIALEAVFESRREDFIARQILAEVSGLTVNDTTQQHTAKIIFGTAKQPQKEFVYTDLSSEFPGYKYDFGTSTYRDEVTGEGGYVYSEPGMYTNVALLDVASMHPTSIIQLNAFGPYTAKFKELLDARMAIKHGDFETAKTMLSGALEPYLDSNEGKDELSYALKIVINIVYGLTAAGFENKFRDPRNKDNIVAKRGALFMIDLKHAVQDQGFTVAHIKTDSIKIPNATPEIIEFVKEFGTKYGYDFEHEVTYDKMCLVNDAVYIAKYQDEKKHGSWTTTGSQFAHPYVFKKLFAGEPIEFDDMCETKTVTTALYLDLNESLPEGEHDYRFVGKAGRFTPVAPGEGGGWLMREKDGKYNHASGSKDYRWLESQMAQALNKKIDRRLFDRLVDEAIANISKYGDFEQFRA